MNWLFRSTLIALLGITQCTSNAASVTGEHEHASQFVPLTRAPIEVPEDELERRACEARLRTVLAEPELPGAIRFDARRLEILTKAKAEPVLLTHAPEFRDDEDPGDLVRGLRKLLAETDHPWDALSALLPRFQARPFLGRAVLLRDGYLYTDDPQTAYALVGLVSAEHLFGHDRIWIVRGENTYFAERKKGRYFFVDGPNEGEQVRLLLLDRIGHGEPPQDTLVRDFRSLRYRLHFNQAKVRRVTADAIVANLRYDDIWVPTVLSSQGAHLEKECEIVGVAHRESVTQARQKEDRRNRVVQALRVSMLQQIEDQLPFDEPRREFGFQLDGKLRGNWLHAYLNGRSSYAFNGDRYFVFNSKGNVHLPQVCVDFLTDTFERASGTWWAPKGQKPQRVLGNLDYEPMNVVERAKLRRVPGFLEHARENPSMFELLEVAPAERVPMGERGRFIEYLLAESDDYQPGDIVVIRGKVPWDPLEMHYHSFFVYDNDPLSGIPLAVVGNAGRPSVRYWEVEAKRTPERAIWYRIRPTTTWLESIISDDVVLPSQPPPISPRGNSG